jgi:hypothetical protein
MNNSHGPGRPQNFVGALTAASATLLVALLAAAPAGASDRIPLGPQTPFHLPAQTPLGGAVTGYCPGFSVLVDYTRSNEYYTTSTAADGTVTQKYTGDARITVTNENTHKSITYNASGPGTFVSFPDGSSSGDLHGPNLLWTKLDKSYPGVPTLSYTTGHVSFHTESSGMTTAYSLSGHRTDVCAALAS